MSWSASWSRGTTGKVPVLLIALALLVAACGGATTPSPTSSGASAPAPSVEPAPSSTTGGSPSPGSGGELDPIVQIAGAAPDPVDGVVEAGKFTKAPPWKIGMSHFGVNANTWTVQVVHETEAAVEKNPNIKDFILLDANLDQEKQVADIEDLIAQKVDILIVMPLTPTSADTGIAAAKAAGIPVVLHTGRVETDAWDVQLQGGAENFGRVMGQFLVEKLGGKGNIWVLRGLQGHPEDINRYNGMLDAFKGSDIKITSEEYGAWQYDTGKTICEQLLINDPNPDGIWFSGSDMASACIDVFKEFGATLPPITGEGNNGFFKRVVRDNIDTISAVYSPSQGAAGIRLAVALLEGKELSRTYRYEPPGDRLEQIKAQVREDLSDNVWWPSELSEEKLQELYGK